MTVVELPHLSAQQLRMLNTLDLRGPQYALQIVRASEGAIARGSVYVQLDRLMDRHLVNSTTPERDPGVGGLRRPRYFLTDLGRRALRAYRAAELAYIDGVE